MEVGNVLMSFSWHIAMWKSGVSSLGSVLEKLIRWCPTATSSPCLSAETVKGRTGEGKCMVILPQSILPSVQLSVDWGTS